MAKLMPPDWGPPYAAYVSDITDAMTVSLTAVQAPSGKEAATASRDLTRLLAGAEGLLHSESVFFDDERGCRNQIAISYWTDSSALDRWRANAAVATFVGAERDDLGIWLEFMSCPRDRFEINNSTRTIKWGVSRHYDAHEDPVHGYYGSMRDRIAAAEDGGLPGARGRLGLKRTTATRGRHLTVELPDNLCFIRTVQGWANCPDEEREYFLQRTYPVYLNGVKFLQSHPVETNCISARLVTHVGDDPQLPQTETIAWFLSLTDLENWVWNHPTHAAIFDAMFTHSKKFNFDVQVLLGHEVLVVPRAGLRAEYHNCHNTTGFLPFFDATDL
ncbi:MAG: phenylacetaldoxime dehydratase family protein [Geminicoccaceae bacterium]